MEITIEGIMLFISWIILIAGIVLLIFIPLPINHYLKGINRNIKDRKMLLDYYITAGITITIIGILLVLIFSNKLILPKF